MKLKRRFKKIFIVTTALTALAASTPFAFAYFLQGDQEVTLKTIKNNVFPKNNTGNTAEENQTLKLMTLNIAHGRQKGPNQIFQKTKKIESNLIDIADVLKREKPDVAALQEADGPSIWSGHMDQVNYLAQNAGFPYAIRGEHVKGIDLAYGTALLSLLPPKNPVSITFDPSPPTFTKGYVLTSIPWGQDKNSEVDIVSVHLDFARKSVRQDQIENMIAKLSGSKNPLIIMGDFNCEWDTENSAIRILAEKLDLKVYQPDNSAMHTFSKLNRRIDWILISSDMEFVSYDTLQDPVSDHYGVVCEIEMARTKIL
ncbi:MAG: endonuclease/exonuclease/phosphatase family protein [Desulfobacterales bacterium]|nr:endonuclease/exonuclease/phosphatase family protein [Desulfobacterales bacterium]